MGKDFGSWFHHQLSDWRSPNLKTLSPPFNAGQQNNIPARMNPCANIVSTNGNFPGLAFSGSPRFNASQQLNEPHGWFYCLPRFRQAFTPVPNSIFKEKISDGHCENHEVVTPIPAPECAQKRFIVFDQSGDQTTLMFSSGIATPVHCPTSFGPKLGDAYDLNKIELGNDRGMNQYGEPVLTDEYNENHGEDVGSEMHEDTEELNALLYSDDDYADDDSEDDEVASTGHSPGTMTADDKQEWVEESAEVASSTGPTKRQKLFSGGYNVPSLMDTASSAKSKRCSDYEDDAESSCAEGKNQGLGESGSLSGNKRSRKDKIRETVGVLQSIIPGGKGKDAIVILDEAISYFRSLKHKAKALGVDTL
ncbi:transcription factor bHLH143-like [Actinidia eriantha]|uniref:transcription factor bHLH143-like n=1 Tax=Actinidia eriantha TaxID=165200 RepID=UPI002589B2F8|nr:transcription factor bHLH143-like [Actinidia eriantha]XP_057470092.1 transcription factor bHLH143-like [Actinidia eriantha]